MPRQYNLYLRNYVGGSSFSPEEVSGELNRRQGQPVLVLIDSTGGSLASGLSISSAFSAHGNVDVHFTGLCASAATIASLGAKHISMATTAFYMIHKASIPVFEWASMNADQIEERCKKLQKQKAELAKFDLQIAAAYAKKCKKPVEDLYNLMSQETWLTAQEALAWGFIDEITDFDDDIAPEITDRVIADLQALRLPVPPITAIAAKSTGMLARIENFFTNIFKNMDTQNTQPQPQQQSAAAGASGPAGNPVPSPQGAENSAEHQASAPMTLEQRLQAAEQRARAAELRLQALEAKLSMPAQALAQSAGASGSAGNPVPGPQGAESPAENGAEQPQAQGTQVVNAGAHSSPASDFTASMKSAADLYKSLP